MFRLKSSMNFYCSLAATWYALSCLSFRVSLLWFSCMLTLFSPSWRNFPSTLWRSSFSVSGWFRYACWSSAENRIWWGWWSVGACKPLLELKSTAELEEVLALIWLICAMVSSLSSRRRLSAMKWKKWLSAPASFCLARKQAVGMIWPYRSKARRWRVFVRLPPLPPADAPPYNYISIWLLRTCFPVLASMALQLATGGRGIPSRLSFGYIQWP